MSFEEGRKQGWYLLEDYSVAVAARFDVADIRPHDPCLQQVTPNKLITQSSWLIAKSGSIFYRVLHRQLVDLAGQFEIEFREPADCVGPEDDRNVAVLL